MNETARASPASRPANFQNVIFEVPKFCERTVLSLNYDSLICAPVESCSVRVTEHVNGRPGVPEMNKDLLSSFV